MKCIECAEGRRIRRNDHPCVYCGIYGMFIREDYECERKGGRPRGDEDHGEAVGEEGGRAEDGAGAA